MGQYNEAVKVLTPVLSYYLAFLHNSHIHGVLLYTLLLRILGKKVNGKKQMILENVKANQEEEVNFRLQGLYNDLGKDPNVNDSVIQANGAEYQKDLMLGLVKKTTAGAALFYFKQFEREYINAPLNKEWATVPLLLKAQKVTPCFAF